jgi:glycosyltransferase involved in cell wall biosynthesis
MTPVQDQPLPPAVAVLHRDPLLLVSWWYAENALQRLQEATAAIPDRPATILVFPAWSLVDWHASGKVAPVARDALAYRARFPLHHLVFAAADPAEAAILQAHGLPGIGLSHNAFFVDPAVFRVQDTAKRFDAVYNAQLKPHKRHELMAGIASACVIYGTVDAGYAASLPPGYAAYDFPNGSPFQEPRRRLGPRQVAACCNMAHVGLCLSAVEGAMLASAEYALCGLPVVSTHCLGGRLSLFESRYCAVVDPDPQAVAAAVQRFKAENPSPHEVRASYLARMFEQRQHLLAYLLGHFARAGVAVDEFALAATILTPRTFPWRRTGAAELRQEVAR